MNYRELNGISIRDGFKKFHQENPNVFTAFEQEALNAIAKGRTKLSAKNIINVIRWNGSLNTTDANFKINDAFQSHYARLFIEKHPSYESYFELRKLRSEEDAPYMTKDEYGQLSFL